MSTGVSFDVEPLIAAAIRAPSSHNSQPWRFRRDGNSIQLLADRTRALPVSDPDGREMIISCGAALFNLRVAAAVAGHGTRDVVRANDLGRAPRGSTTDLLASVALEGRPSRRLAELGDAIESRHTHRGAFRRNGVDGATVASLDALAADHRIALNWVPGPQRDGLAELVARATCTQFADRAWRAELASWMKPAAAGDGLLAAGVGGAIGRQVVRWFDVGKGQALAGAAAVRDAPLVAVLSTGGDTPADWLRMGEALEHLLLAGATQGLQARYVNQPCQVEAARQHLRSDLGLTGFPQLVVLLGVPVDSPRRPSVRRPLEAVLAQP